MAGGLFWFLIGAGTATIWSKHHEQDANGGVSRWQSHCNRKRVATEQQQSEPSGSAPPADPPRYQERGPWGWGRGEAKQDSLAPAPYVETPREKEFRQFSKQAGDAMTDLSEATLDTLMATIMAAKNKLADRRIQRDVEEKRQLDGQRR